MVQYEGTDQRTPHFISFRFISLNDMPGLNLQSRTDAEMSDELKHVAKGFERRVQTFNGYDVNGYRFQTRSHELARPNRKTTNSGVRTPGTDERDYYGIVEEIYELTFSGLKALKAVVFKCHWFDPDATRRAPEIGLVETRQDSVYRGDDVYIVAQQATQVYYLPWACQEDENLNGWYIVQLVSPRGKAPLPNDDDYNFDPNTYSGEFFQPEGLEGRFHIDISISSLIGMEEENDFDEDEGDEVQNAKDLRMLERLQLGGDFDVDEGDEDEGFDNIDSDDDTRAPRATAARGDNF